MKICVIAGRYALSGVPLGQLKLAKALSRLGHKVELIYGDINPGHKIPYSKHFIVRTLNKVRVSSMFFDLIRMIKKKNFDIIFSAGDHLNAVVLITAILARSNVKISCSSRVTPYDTYSNKIFSKGWFLKQIMKILMHRGNVFTCVSKEMVHQYRRVFYKPKHVCIYNIVKNYETDLKMREPINEEWLLKKKEPVIIAAGMLEPWKGFVDLVIAFKKLIKIKKAKLIILGDGSMRKQLQRMINFLDLKNSVKLKGFVENPLKYFSRANVFALSSHVEGMPNVLIEAMMAGCTPVATDCKTGPREVLENGRYGYLVKVKDPDSLCRGLIKALEKPIPKHILAEAVIPFTEKKILMKHFEYLDIKDKL